MGKGKADMVQKAIDELPNEMSTFDTVALFLTILSAYKFDQEQASDICYKIFVIVLSGRYNEVLDDE